MQIGKFLSMLLILCSLGNLWSQNLNNSPYARYGLGDLSFSPFPHMNGLGMTAIAYADSHTVNPLNPASLITQRFTVLEMGMYGSRTNFVANNLNTNANNAGFGYLTLAFGIVPKKWSTSIGVRPLTLAGYEINSREFAGPDIGTVNYLYQGAGGFNVLHFNNGFKVAKNFYAGVNTNYNFGNMRYSRSVIFSDSLNALNSRITEDYILSDFNFDLGIRYELFFKPAKITKKDKVYITKDDSLFSGRRVLKEMDGQEEKYYLISKTRTPKKDSLRVSFGATYTPSIRASARYTYLADRFLRQPPIENVVDTILFIDDQSGRIIMPEIISGGLYIRSTSEKLALSLNAQYLNWNNFSRFGQSDSLKNNLRLNVGVQYIPDVNATKRYASRIRYRAGFTYSDGYLRINNTDIQEYFLSAGLGLPFRRQRNSTATKVPISLLNVALQAGYRGTTSNNLIQERFIRLSFGLSMTDDWFNKRKYD
ncbi:MAG: hypothetical protein ACK4GL_08150 [Flavobacteriales bacterium]